MSVSGWCVLGLAVGVAVACGGSGQSSAIACDATHPCPSALACQQGICVASDGGGATGGVAGASSGGSAGLGGAAGSGANGGTGGVSGGDSGLGGSAGDAGGGGAAGGSGGTPPCNETLIDDMESALGGKLPECDGRVGGWFTANDTLAGTLQTPAPLPPSQYAFPYYAPGASGTGYAINTFGTTSSVASAWGALVGLALNDSGTGSEAYDAESRGYVGVRFKARRSGTTASSLRVEFADMYTDPGGGFCTTACFDHWGTTITLSSTWTTYIINWSQLTSGTWGVPNQSFEPGGMFVIQWLFPPNVTFDLYLDDVEFVTS